MRRATKIRLYPTADQQNLIARQMGCVRFVWNKALNLKKTAWDERWESLSIADISALLPSAAQPATAISTPRSISASMALCS